MPRSGPPSYTYSLPPIYIAIPGTTITAAQHNDPLEDIADTFNSITPVVWGGTGASSAAAARAALGLVIGTDVQAYSAVLTALTTLYTLASASGAASLAFAEDTDNGTNKVTVQAPASVTSDKIMTLPDATDTFVGKATTDTLTNKRITKRVTSEASNATPTPNADTDDGYQLTALAAAAAFAAPTGTPTNQQPLLIRIKDNGTARALSWNAAYRAVGITLPTTTVISKTLYVGFFYNSADSVWDGVATAQQA